MARKPKRTNQPGTMKKLTAEQVSDRHKLLLNHEQKRSTNAIIKDDEVEGEIVIDSGIYEERILTGNGFMRLESNCIDYDLAQIESEVRPHVDSTNSYLADDARECLRSLALLRRTIAAIDGDASCQQIVPLAGPVRLPLFEALTRLAMDVGKLREQVFVKQREAPALDSKRAMIRSKTSGAKGTQKLKVQSSDKAATAAQLYWEERGEHVSHSAAMERARQKMPSTKSTFHCVSLSQFKTYMRRAGINAKTKRPK